MVCIDGYWLKLSFNAQFSILSRSRSNVSEFILLFTFLNAIGLLDHCVRCIWCIPPASYRSSTIDLPLHVFILQAFCHLLSACIAHHDVVWAALRSPHMVRLGYDRCCSHTVRWSCPSVNIPFDLLPGVFIVSAFDVHTYNPGTSYSHLHSQT